MVLQRVVEKQNKHNHFRYLGNKKTEASASVFICSVECYKLRASAKRCVFSVGAVIDRESDGSRSRTATTKKQHRLSALGEALFYSASVC